MIATCTFNGRRQILAVADLHDPETLPRIERMLGELGGRCDLVYSDPPWNPGNEKYWRNHAGATPTPGYPDFLDAWCRVVSAAIARGASDVLCEQSTNEVHRGMFLDAVGRAGWPLPLAEWWEVYYGSPGSASVRHPNMLLHFGRTPLGTSPQGMAGEPMTIRACAGLRHGTGSVVLDPCMGKGMTSRMAHYFGWDCVGVELNPARLEKAITWLERQGYHVERS